MPETTSDPMTANRMAKALGVPETKVKAALEQLAIEPCARKGCCRLYAAQDLERVRQTLQG